MTASRTRRKPSRRLPRPTRPVTEVLLELAYFLHATRPVGKPAKGSAAPAA